MGSTCHVIPNAKNELSKSVQAPARAPEVIRNGYSFLLAVRTVRSKATGLVAQHGDSLVIFRFNTCDDIIVRQ